MLLVTIPVAAGAGGFIPQVLKTRDAQTNMRLQSSFPELNSASLTQPADMRADSTYASLEYTAENLLRTKRAGKLTADMQTWGSSQSLFVPLHLSRRSTTLAFSNTSSNASLYYATDSDRTDLTWTSGTNAYAINQNTSFGNIGLATFWSSATAPGESTYPAQVFNVFSGLSPIDFRLDQRVSVLQCSGHLSSTGVSVKVGGGPTRLKTTVCSGSSVLSIPAEVNMDQRGIDLTRHLGDHLTGSVGFSRSDGSGCNQMYLDTAAVGKLRYNPDYRQTSTALVYKSRSDTTWQLGLDHTEWDLSLHGISINGDKLKLDLKPFSEKVDFNGSVYLATRTVHIGFDRRMSDTLSWGWIYKYARVRSCLSGDYVGRAFFGLISASGSYDDPLINTTIHGIDLSMKYAHRRTSLELRVEQIIPQASHSSSHHTTYPDTPRQPGASNSTGGTTISLDCGYAF